MTVDPVASFYAPQARLIDVDTDQVVGGRTGTGSDRVDLDIVSARVTLLSSGVSQLTVVLNNQLFDDFERPTTPPWKYNGLDRIRFGQKIRLDLRYGDRPWTKMILAQVNDLQFSFAASGPALVTVTAEDLLCLLKRAPQQDVEFEDGLQEERIAETTIRAGLAEAIAPVTFTIPTGQVEMPEIADDGTVTIPAALSEWPQRSHGLPPQRHIKSQTYLQFLQQIAERMDLELFVDFLSNYLPATDDGVAPGAQTPRPAAGAPLRNDLVFHFEPTRSLIPAESERRVVDLTWGQNLLSFTPRLKLWDMISSVRVRGRPRLSATAIDRQIAGADADTVVATDLADQSGAPLRAVTATELRRTLLGAAALPTERPVEFANLDEERAMIKARKILLDGAREMLTVEAAVIGVPALRPGLHVRIQGLYPPFNGIYYVTKTVHSFDATGYRTQVSLRRPGMLPPEKYPMSIVEQERRRTEATT